MKLFDLVEKYFAIVLLVAVGIGFAFPQLNVFYFATSFMFAVAIFLASLKVDFELFIEQLKQFRYFAKKFFLIRIVVPIIVYFVTLAIAPEFALGTFLVLAIPCGITNIIYSDISKGNNSLTLLFTLTTHLVSPILIPLMVFLVSFQAIELDYVGLFLSLAQIVLLPVMLAYFVKTNCKNKVEKVEDSLSGISILLIASIVAVVVAQNATKITDYYGFALQFIYISIIYMVLTFAAVYFTKKESNANQIAISLSTWRTNINLALVIASMYFPINVVTVVIAAKIAVDTHTAIHKVIIDRYLK